jgi:hypothetical protein
VGQLDDILSSIDDETGETITISFSLPMLKTLALECIIECFLRKSKLVHYLDLDLQFSCLIENFSTRIIPSKNLLQIFRSNSLQVVDLILSLLNSQHPEKGGILVVDSIGTLQTLLTWHQRDRMDFVKSNHEAAILLTLMQEFATRNSKILLITNVMRPRPNKNSTKREWDMEISGGRMIRLKSNAIISATGIRKSPTTKDQSISFRVETVDDRLKEKFGLGKDFELFLKPFTLK